MHPSQMEKSSRTRCESHPVLHLQCIHSMGFGTWKTTGELFTSELEKEKVHEEKEEMGEGEENTWREGRKGAER